MSLDDVINAVADKVDVDWAAAEADLRGTPHAQRLHDLKMLAHLQQLHHSGGAPTVEKLQSVGGRGDVADPHTVRFTSEATNGSPDVRPDSVCGGRWGKLRLEDRVGEGASCVVYRARDPELDRDVALKLLRNTSDRAPRLEEGRRLARVRHPNVVTVHGADTVVGATGIWMEFIDGDTLHDLVRERGRFGAYEAAVIGRDICRALAAVHGASLLHRDLTAKNVMRERGGRIVLMDFGIGISLQLTNECRNAAGTPLYTAPEILRGERPTVQADIYSVGVLLWYLVTGSYPHYRTSLPELIDATSQPVALRNARADLPEEFVRVVERALAPRAADRYPDAGAIERALSQFLSPGRDAAASGHPRNKRRWLVALGLAGILGAAVIWSYALKAPPLQTSVSRFTLTVPETDTLVSDDGLALSPNGRTIVYSAWHNGTRQLFRRALDQTEAVPIAGTEGAAYPFFSPDGQWIGFFVDNALKKVPSAGGPAMTICPAGYRAGASWGPNGLIVFASTTSPDLMQVADTGGTPRPLTAMARQNTSAVWPELTPDGRAVLYTIRRPRQTGRIVVRSIDTGAERDLVQGTSPRLTATGHLVFARAGELWAVPFDHKRLTVTASPVKVVEGVEVFGFGSGMALFSVARDGSLAHATPGKAIVVALDRTGRPDVLLDVPHSYFSEPQPSPDGHQLALAFNDRAGDSPAIWIYELDRRQLRRLTLGQSWDIDPLWTPDGKRIVFSSDRGGSGRGLFWIAADGSDGDVAERLTSGPGRPRSWTRDGRVLAFVGGGTIWTLGVDPARKPEVFLQQPYPAWDAEFSPDGRWLAHASRESGQDEVYVRPFPAAGSRWRVSSQGGWMARWSPDGKELFYLNPEFELMAAAVTFRPTFQVAAPRALFKAARRPGAGTGDAAYSVMPDGQHFVTLQAASTQRQIQVTLNWIEDLKQRMAMR